LETLAGAISSITILIFSLVIHENAHARIAYLLGDPSAKYAGRFSFNPMNHLNWTGTLLPIILYLSNLPVLGFANPVPAEIRNFRCPKRDICLVALAGPLSNLVLAFLGALLYDKLSFLSDILLASCNELFFNLIITNLLLCFFNLLPIPPLDGSRVLMCFFIVHAPRIAERIELYGSFSLLAIIFILPSIGNYMNIDANIISNYGLWAVKKTLVLFSSIVS
jgi:Zn-dependent protease